MYESVPANIALFSGIAAMLVGTVLLLWGTPRSSEGVRRSRRRVIAAFALLEVGVALWLVSSWTSGTGWVPGLVIASVVYVLLLAYVTFTLWRAYRSTAR